MVWFNFVRGLAPICNVSGGSFHTPSSGTTPNSSGHVPPRFAVPGQDGIVKEVLEKLTQRDKKSESHQNSILQQELVT